MPQIEKQPFNRELDRDNTATTSFISVPLSSHSSLHDQFLSAAVSDSDSSASYTRTPEIWNLTPLPPVEQSPTSNRLTSSPRSASPDESSADESDTDLTREILKSSPTYTVLSPVVVSAPASPRDATIVISRHSSHHSHASISSRSSPTSKTRASRDGSASSVSHRTALSREREHDSAARSRVADTAGSMYSDDFESDEERVSKTPAPSPLFVKRTPPVVRSPTEEDIKRERLGREKTAPGGLEREILAWKPLPPPSPSPTRLSAGSPARNSAGTPDQPSKRINSFSTLKAHTFMNRWRAPQKTPNRYLVISEIWCLVVVESEARPNLSGLRTWEIETCTNRSPILNSKLLKHIFPFSNR